MNIITFVLQKNEHFVIKSEYKLSDIAACDELPIFFESTEENYVVHCDFIADALSRFSLILKKALNKKLYLDHSITKDIGYLWNCELHGDSDLLYKKHKGQLLWVGMQHHLWETPGNVYPNLATWIYNTAHGIVLEITPIYPWHFIDPEADQKALSYEAFMKDYAPLVVRIIPNEVAVEWQQQASKLLHTITTKK